eukprot:jgi/Botrbrau1/5426/Bobra.182_1s0028.1
MLGAKMWGSPRNTQDHIAAKHVTASMLFLRATWTSFGLARVNGSRGGGPLWSFFWCFWAPVLKHLPSRHD